MDLLYKILKVGGLVTLILAFALVVAPTLRGPFVVVHFATALRGWLLAQLAMLGLTLAAGVLCRRMLAWHELTPVRVSRNGNSRNSSTRPMRC